jgi:hypothetical protein
VAWADARAGRAALMARARSRLRVMLAFRPAAGRLSNTFSASVKA